MHNSCIRITLVSLSHYLMVPVTLTEMDTSRKFLGNFFPKKRKKRWLSLTNNVFSITNCTSTSKRVQEIRRITSISIKNWIGTFRNIVRAFVSGTRYRILCHYCQCDTEKINGDFQLRNRCLNLSRPVCAKTTLLPRSRNLKCQNSSIFLKYFSKVSKDYLKFFEYWNQQINARLRDFIFNFV